jgi:phosphoenolpyruvate carboxylase
MADKPMERDLRDVMAKVDEDLRQYVPPKRLPDLPEVEPAAELVAAADGTAETIMRAVEEVEKKAAHLREMAEHAMASLKEWTDEFARQHAQVINQCETLKRLNEESVERITQIGTKPSGPNGQKR